MNNMTDIIEQYIKNLFKDSQQDYITLKRSNVAEKFSCVPSQLNYVIKTRFTPEHGFLIESKRGGGGFIRITKITLHQNIDYLDFLIESIENEEDNNIDYNKILKILKQDKYINHFDYVMIETALNSFIENHINLINITSEIDISLASNITKMMNKNKKEMMIKFITNIKYNKENN